MALGSLSSLGIGSGVLNSNVIEGLKKADESAVIAPQKKRLGVVEDKEKELSSLITKLSILKSSASDFVDGTLLSKRVTDVSGSSVSANANDGVSPQTITMDVSQIAKNDIYQSKKFDSMDTKINNTGEEQTLKLGLNGMETDIKVKDGATLSDLRDAINNSGADVVASIIDTGSDNNPYQLVLKSNQTGKDANIKLDFSDIDDLGFNDTKYQSKQYSSSDDSVTDEDTTIKFKVNGTTYSMDVAANTSASDFVDDINNNSDMQDAGISASYNNDTNRIEFHMKEIGDVEIDEGKLNTDINSETDFTNDNRLQTAQNANFKFNGVEVTRATNEVKDLVIGLTININDKGSSTIHIKRDDDGIKNTIQDFVSNYNSILSDLQTKTGYNEDTKQAGVFQNESSIVSIPRELNNEIFSSFVPSSVKKTDRNGQEYNVNISLTATDFGFGLNRTGLMDFDMNKFSKMLENKPDETSSFLKKAFSGLNDRLKSLVTDPNSDLNNLNQQYKSEEKSYKTEIDRNQKMLDMKYEMMANQFAAYDAVINKYQMASSMLDTEIKAAINSK